MANTNPTQITEIFDIIEKSLELSFFPILKEVYMDWLEEVNTEEERVTQIFSFSEYMDILNKSPKCELRTSAQYLKDMFNFLQKF